MFHQEELHMRELLWIRSSLDIQNLARSSRLLLNGLQRLLTNDPNIHLDTSYKFLLASILNPSLGGAQNFVDVVLQDETISFLSYIDTIYDPISKEKNIENIDKFWRITLDDTQALAGRGSIEDFHWITSQFLGDTDRNKIKGKTGRTYLASFDSWTNAALAVSLSKRDWSWAPDLLLRYFSECEKTSSGLVYSGVLALGSRENKIVVEPIDLWPKVWVGRDTSTPHLQVSPAFSLGDFISLDLIRQLEEILNSPHVSESLIQKFLEEHPDFLFLIGDYEGWKSQISLSPQVLMSYEAKEGERPDFFLRDSRTNFWDLLEIKRPDVNLVKGVPHRRRWSDAFMEGRAQLIEYRHYFDDKTDRQWVKDRYGIDVLCPQLYLLIGRDHSFHNWAEKRVLMDAEKEVKVVTYDDLLHLAYRRWLLRPNYPSPV
jgi:hypothetical protein